jgi:cold shock CspA family protein
MTQKAGVIKFFNKARSFGFIRPDGEDGEVFLHAAHVVGGWAVSPGIRVRYSIGTERDGRKCAVDVRMDHGAR